MRRAAGSSFFFFKRAKQSEEEPKKGKKVIGTSKEKIKRPNKTDDESYSGWSRWSACNLKEKQDLEKPN